MKHYFWLYTFPHWQRLFVCVIQTNTHTHILVWEKMQRIDAAGTRVKSNDVSEGQHSFVYQKT